MAHLNASLCARGARQFLPTNSSSIHGKTFASKSRRFSGMSSSGQWDFLRRHLPGVGGGRMQISVVGIMYDGGVIRRAIDDHGIIFLSAADFICLNPCDSLCFDFPSDRLYIQTTLSLDLHLSLLDYPSHHAAICRVRTICGA